ncbi:hypothetical protein ACFPK9_00525 [Rubritalea spongiae]|uniref:Uncharacterized protein n=1 Tax=Rubritalea spongiae TaxID=430797 RepID=A0ABW5E271_9BACT
MKYLIPLLLTISATATEMTTQEVTASDVAVMLELTPDKLDIRKTQITLNHPQVCELEITSSTGNKNILKLPGKHSKVTLIRYTTQNNKELKQCELRLIGTDSSAVSSYFFYERSKAPFTREKVVDGVYTITAGESDKLKNIEYEVRLLTN